MPQLTLDLYRDAALDFASFVAAGNAETVTALKQFAADRGPRGITLWGPRGCGKTHLLQATVSVAASHGHRAMYLPLSAVKDSGASMLDGLSTIDLLAIDELEVVANISAWEQALFHLYNGLNARDGRIVCAASGPVTSLFALPDLSSRMVAGLVYPVHELNDDGKVRVLQQKAAARGLSLSDQVVQFIMRRSRRDLGELVRVIDVLDEASLRDGRVLTVPYVRSLMLDAD